MDGVTRKPSHRNRRWPEVGERVLLAGKHPFAGEAAVVLRLEAPWGIRQIFGAFPRVRTMSGREDYIIQKTEWVSLAQDARRARARARAAGR